MAAVMPFLFTEHKKARWRAGDGQRNCYNSRDICITSSLISVLRHWKQTITKINKTSPFIEVDGSGVAF